MKQISRETALIGGLARYFTGIPCPRGHVSERQTGSKACIECRRENDLARYRRIAEQERERKRRHYAENRNEKQAKSRANYWRNAARERQRSINWMRNNREKYNAQSAARRADKLRRTPAWANMSAIRCFYDAAQRATAQTGELYVVDHIIPLKGRTVSGLHVENNLQILTALQNAAKGNSFSWGDA